MSAPLNPNQLSMFMPARQILETHALGDALSQGDKTRSKMMQRKSRENEKYGLPDMSEPITISHDEPWPGARGRPVVYDGHHRLAEGVRRDIEVPVQHIDSKNIWTMPRTNGGASS